MNGNSCLLDFDKLDVMIFLDVLLMECLVCEIDCWS